jgi:DnaJ-domain-containing protein 1
VVERLHEGSDASGSPDPSDSLPHLADLDVSAERRNDYAEWAERMKSKRQEKVETIRAAERPASPGPTYWSSDALFEESRRLEEDDQGVVATRTELLAVLGLPPNADEPEVVRTYRRLAKEHHPDRYPDAEQAIRDLHVEKMQRITAAYRALQRT